MKFHLNYFIFASIAIHIFVVIFLTLRPAPPLAMQTSVVNVNFVEDVGHHAQQMTVKPRSTDVVRPAKKTEVSTPASTTPPPTAPATTPASNTAVNSYVTEIVQLINRHKIYPQSAIDREQEGTVVVQITLNRDGTQTAVQISIASPFSALNEAALRTLSQIRRFPPPPEGSAPTLHLTIPFQFRIEHH